jgi:hypothetical protein
MAVVQGLSKGAPDYQLESIGWALFLVMIVA